MSLYHKLEAKYARWSIPSLIKILAIFQVVVWLLVKIQPEFLNYLQLNRELVFHGQIWRILTWVFYVGDIHWLFVVFYVMFVFAISDTLDAAWGIFKVNLFVFGGMLAVIAYELVLGGLFTGSSNALGFYPYGMWFNSSIIMAFASVAPRFQVMLFFVIPVQMKWLGIVSGALLFIQGINSPHLFLPILSACTGFLVAWVPGYLRERRGLATPRPNLEAFRPAQASSVEAFHLCHQCGKTELDDKSLSFRVAADGEEYCSSCRSTTKAS